MTIKTAKELADETVQDQKDRHANPDKYRGYKFSSPWFMKLTGGWGRDWICFIRAKAGMGKTSWLTTATVEFGRNRVPFMYFSMEESLQVSAQRVFSNLQPINRTKFRDVTLEPTDWPNVYEAAKSMGQFVGWFVDSTYDQNTFEQYIKQFMPAVILFDYLQLMDFPGSTSNERVVNASGWLQGLAHKKVTGKPHLVIAAAQLNDNGEVLYSRDPDRHGDLNIDIEDIDDGYGVPKKDEKRINVRKFRYGSLDSTVMSFIGQRSLIGDMAKPTPGPIPKPPHP